MVWNPKETNYVRNLQINLKITYRKQKIKNIYKHLAVGFEKIRNEHTILVWDITGNSNNPALKLEHGGHNTEIIIYTKTYNTTARNSISNPNTLANITTSMNSGSMQNFYSYSAINSQGYVETNIKPVFEAGTSDSCNSLSWNPHDGNFLLAGMLAGTKAKSLRIYDIRGIIFKLIR